MLHYNIIVYLDEKMKIIVGKESGFCFGVKRAVDGVKEDVKNLDNLFSITLISLLI